MPTVYKQNGEVVDLSQYPKLKDTDQITVIAKRWFQKTYGNTYHSCEVWLNGQSIGRVDRTYGYGDSYRQTALEIMQKADLFPKLDNLQNGACGSSCFFRDYFYEHRNQFIFSVTDVARQKDL